MRTEEEFRLFIKARSSSLLQVAFLLTGDRGHAEDLLQAALLKTYRHWSRLSDSDAAAYAYVRKTMVTTNISWARRRRVLEHLSADPPEITGPLIDSAAGDDRVRELLAALPAAMRTVIVLRFYEQLTEAETAAVIGRSVGTVKSQTSRGVARLRALMISNENASARQGEASRE